MDQLLEQVQTSSVTRAEQIARVFGYVRGLHATHLMALGRTLGLFDCITSHPAGVQFERLAAAGLHAPYVRQWCETACALELLDYDPAAGYRLAPFMDEILGSTGATYYLGGFPVLHTLLARDYARYPELFETGGTYRYQDHDEQFLRSMALASATLPRMFLNAVVPKLPDLHARLLAGARILDVGCGGGSAIVELAKHFPSVRCVGLDVDRVSIRIAQAAIEANGLGDRVQAHLVDGATWPEQFTSAFDLVTMFLVLHEIRPDMKDVVLERCARSLRPNGQLLIFDEGYPSKPGDLGDAGSLFSVIAQWYEMSWGNAIDTREQILARLDRQGMRVSIETDLSRFYIVTAVR